MNSKIRNLTLAAAALAALTVIAPKASADERGHVRGPGSHAPAFHAPAWRGPSRAYVAPARPFVRYGYGYRAPYRAFAGFRFYPYCPGPGYVYVASYGWALPPFFGAVWIPGHYDIGGFWVEGFWQ